MSKIKEQLEIPDLPEMKEFDFKNLGNAEWVIGELTEEIILKMGLDVDPGEIVINKWRIRHIKKHKKDFQTEEEFWEHINEIPNILKSPDYIGPHPDGGSLQFIKKINENMLVAVKVQDVENLTVWTAYLLKNTTLQNYIASGRIHKV